MQDSSVASPLHSCPHVHSQYSTIDLEAKKRSAVILESGTVRCTIMVEQEGYILFSMLSNQPLDVTLESVCVSMTKDGAKLFWLNSLSWCIPRTLEQVLP